MPSLRVHAGPVFVSFAHCTDLSFTHPSEFQPIKCPSLSACVGSLELLVTCTQFLRDMEHKAPLVCMRPRQASHASTLCAKLYASCACSYAGKVALAT